MNYIEVLIEAPAERVKENLVAELAAIGFSGFDESGSDLKAYIEQPDYNQVEVYDIMTPYGLKYSQSVIGEQNWNAVWESNFEPLIVNDLVTEEPWVSVRAHFHTPAAGIAHEIVITPKMSFGTGHHATTYMVMQLMKGIDFEGNTVFDFGTGTGILAILAEQLGAKAVVGVDNDDWCIENAQENIERNGCSKITIKKVETAASEDRYDIVIANINKNIILDNLGYLADMVVPGGPVLLSGLLKEDEQDILDATHKKGWKHIKTINKGMWIAIQLVG